METVSATRGSAKESRYHAAAGFALSARPALWPAIVVSSFAFRYLLEYDVTSSWVLSAILCVTASIGFLINDMLDRKIDEANNVARWSPKSVFDFVMFSSVVALYLALMVVGYFQLTRVSFVALVASMALVVAYSVLCKRIILLGNLLAAGLSLTPGLIMFLDTYLSRPRLTIGMSVCAAFLVLGFLLFVSREMRFDEFDEFGDRIGGRVTVPMVISRSFLKALHGILCGTALLVLWATIAVAGKHVWPINFMLGLTTTTFTAGMLVLAYQSGLKRVFAGTTRVVMLVIPVSILFSF